MTGIETETIETRVSRGKRQWEEAWGSLASAKANWQRIAFVLAGALALSIGGLVYLGSLPKQVLYVVERDRFNNVAYAGPAKPREMSDEAWTQIKVDSLKRFIEEARTVTTDRTAAEKNWDKAFSHVGDGSTAKAKLSEWFDKHDPIQRATNGETVEFNYKTFDVEGANTYGIWWQEITRKAGQIASDRVYRARIVYAMKIPSSAAAKAENPVGVLATDYSVEEVHQ